MRCASIRSKGEHKQLQHDINEWLKDHPDVKICYITQAERASKGLIITTFFYEE